MRVRQQPVVDDLALNILLVEALQMQSEERARVGQSATSR